MKHDALRGFLGELIDDAGLFPPARLPMAEALAAHERALGSESYWLVGRFVAPASRFDETIAELDDAPRPLATSVVVDGTPPLDAMLAALARHAGAEAARATVEALELPFARLAGDTDDDRLRALERNLAGASLSGKPDVYVELTLGDAAEGQLLAIHRARIRGFAVCAKVRCGGLEASAVPAASTLAHVIWTANRLDVPFKATAGLHHALPYDDASIGARTHGFLNVIGAAVLAHARGIDRETIEALLTDRDPAHFHLDATRFAWSDIGADADEIGEARALFVHSYGSCSLEEPVADLRALDMLPAFAH